MLREIDKDDPTYPPRSSSGYLAKNELEIESYNFAFSSDKSQVNLKGYYEDDKKIIYEEEVLSEQDKLKEKAKLHIRRDSNVTGKKLACIMKRKKIGLDQEELKLHIHLSLIFLNMKKKY